MGGRWKMYPWVCHVLRTRRRGGISFCPDSDGNGLATTKEPASIGQCLSIDVDQYLAWSSRRSPSSLLIWSDLLCALKEKYSCSQDSGRLTMEDSCWRLYCDRFDRFVIGKKNVLGTRFSRRYCRSPPSTHIGLQASRCKWCIEILSEGRRCKRSRQTKFRMSALYSFTKV